MNPNEGFVQQLIVSMMFIAIHNIRIFELKITCTRSILFG